MDLLFVTTELAPFVKVGGLGDVSAALPKALRLLGHSVTVLLPRYACLETSGLLLARRLTPLSVDLGDRVHEVTVFDGRLASQVELVLVDAPGMYDRPEVYGENGEVYPDSDVRFALLCRAAAEVARQRAQQGRPFDVVHCNDWPTALVPAHLLALRAETPSLAATRSVLTIHNASHQGIFPRESVGRIGLGWDAFHVDKLEFYGKVNFLKMGLVTADAVTTVSETYALSIQTAEHGHGLEGVLAAHGHKLLGIVNGVDGALWNPATDPHLVARYDAEDFANKARCKGALQRELGLPLDTEAPLAIFVGRAVAQKGVDVLAETIPRLLRATDIQLVVAGDGEVALQQALREAAARSYGRCVYVGRAGEALVHRMFSAADLTLVPSRFEPCGLVQLYGQRYGAVPVARATGGLVDTIVDCDAKLETGTGFLFDEPTAEALLGATERALAARTSPRWPALVRRVMRLDRGWERAARRYERLYRGLSARAAGAA